MRRGCIAPGLCTERYREFTGETQGFGAIHRRLIEPRVTLVTCSPVAPTAGQPRPERVSRRPSSQPELDDRRWTNFVVVRPAHWGLQGEHGSETHGQWNPQHGRRVGGVFGDVATAFGVHPRRLRRHRVDRRLVPRWPTSCSTMSVSAGSLSPRRENNAAYRDDEFFNAILLEPQPDRSPVGGIDAGDRRAGVSAGGP